jgi:hypothetical protein
MKRQTWKEKILIDVPEPDRRNKSSRSFDAHSKYLMTKTAMDHKQLVRVHMGSPFKHGKDSPWKARMMNEPEPSQPHQVAYEHGIWVYDVAPGCPIATCNQ